jgi:hypothetical protein
VSIRRDVKIRVAVGSRRGRSSVRSGDHRKLRLLCSPPGLRLAELNASSVAGHDFIRSGHECSDSTRSEYKSRRQSSSCRRTYTAIPNRKTLPKNGCRPKYFYTEWTQATGSARSVYEALSKGVHLSKSRSSRSPHELDIDKRFFRKLQRKLS